MVLLIFIGLSIQIWQALCAKDTGKPMIMIKSATTSDMRTLASCLNKLISDGYTEDFKVSEMGLLSQQHEKIYQPSEINIVNFYRFEGASDPADNSIIYVIETADDIKGTLIDAYGPYADQLVNRFMEEVASINKKAVHSDSTKN